MSYVETNLTPGEQIAYRGELHWGIYVNGLLVLLLGAVGRGTNAASNFFLGLGFVLLVVAFMRKGHTEMAVTNKRVIMKRGVLSLKTLELNLAKIENISVHQGILGRILGYGTIIVVGTGGSQEPFPKIADPLDFKRAVQQQWDAAGQANPKAA